MFTKDCIIFDLETTGFDPAVNEIVEIGAKKYKDGIAIESFSMLVKPEKAIPRKITELTGISNDMVEDADDILTVLDAFLVFCEGYPLVAYNLPFDRNFLLRKSEECGLDFTLNKTRLGMDALQVARKSYPKFETHKLASMIQQLGINVDTKNAHRALNDVVFTKLVLDRCEGFIFKPLVEKEYGHAQTESAGLPLF